MARKRIVSPEFFTHDGLYEAERASGLPLRLAFAGLWTQADRRGVFTWKPLQLKLSVLPFDEGVDMAEVLAALESAGFVKSYLGPTGKRFGYLPAFARWQTFHRNEQPSDAPPPPEDIVTDPESLAQESRRGWITRETRAAVMARDGDRCVSCGRAEHLTLDHITPFSEGGSHEADNLQVLCRACNSRKGTSATFRPAPDRELQHPANRHRPVALVLQPPARTATTPVAVTSTSTGTSTGTASASHSRRERDGERAASEPPPPLTGVVLLTVAANTGIAAVLGEQPHPIRSSAPTNQEAADKIAAAGVPDDFAARVILDRAKAVSGRERIRSLWYFVQAVVDAWGVEKDRRAAAQFSPGSEPPETDAEVFAARLYAAAGDAAWQAHCDERGIVWRPDAAVA